MYIPGQHYSSKIASISGQKPQNFAGRKKTRLTQQEYDAIKENILHSKQSPISITGIIQQVKDLLGRVIDKRDIYSVKQEINRQSICEVGYPYYIFPFSRSTSPYSGSLNDVSIIEDPQAEEIQAQKQQPQGVQSPKIQRQLTVECMSELPKRNSNQNSIDFIQNNKSAIDSYIKAENAQGRKPTRKDIEAMFNLRPQAVKDWNHCHKNNPIQVNTNRSERAFKSWTERSKS